MASSTCSSVAMGERESLARDSVMRIMASSWRTVMGIEERTLAADSEAATRRRMETKWEESFSAADGERRGAQRLRGNQCQCSNSMSVVVERTHDLQKLI